MFSIFIVFPFNNLPISIQVIVALIFLKKIIGLQNITLLNSTQVICIFKNLDISIEKKFNH